MSKQTETKKVVKVNENELIEMINDLVLNEVQKSKQNWLAEEKVKWISESKNVDANKVSILESKITKLEELVSQKLK